MLLSTAAMSIASFYLLYLVMNPIPPPISTLSSSPIPDRPRYYIWTINFIETECNIFSAYLLVVWEIIAGFSTTLLHYCEARTFSGDSSVKQDIWDMNVLDSSVSAMTSGWT